MRDGEAERIKIPPRRRGLLALVHSFLELPHDNRRVGMQARPSLRRPPVSWIDDGGSMPVPDGRMRGIRSIRERDFLRGRVRSWPESTVCSRQSEGLPSPFNRRTRRVPMLSINAGLKRRALELT